MRKAFGSPIVDLVCRYLFAPILLFASYVLFHGHYSPGGGFQAGVIAASAFILIRLVWGENLILGLTNQRAIGLACFGAFLYAFIGLSAFLFNGNYLDYGVLPIHSDVAQRRALGILGIEIGVAMVVSNVLILVYQSLIFNPERKPMA